MESIISKQYVDVEIGDKMFYTCMVLKLAPNCQTQVF
jgi:hypothetical protein